MWSEASHSDHDCSIGTCDSLSLFLSLSFSALLWSRWMATGQFGVEVLKAFGYEHLKCLFLFVEC